MCGIAGHHGSKDVNIREMLEVIRHRGPDSQGVYESKKVCLGSQRLSIVDEENGDQPISNEDETIWTVFNGEIYNHEGLRSRLASKGHRFSTSSDTEILVHAYEEWGLKCFEKLRGMYAVALWDEKTERLYLARDPIGKKPLYYFADDSNLLFGSEIKSILAADRYEKELEISALRHFLAYGYSKGSKTLFSGIRKLEPGELICFSDKGIRRTEIKMRASEKVPDTLDGAADRLRNILEEEIQNWAREGGSYSVFLSGGIDSSAVLALLSEIDNVTDLKAYTAGFQGSKYDESQYAEEVTDYLGVEHEVIETPRNAVQMIPELVNYYDDLMADQACIPYYLLSERASGHSKVSFTGSGADELFGGYEHYQIMDMGSRYAKPFPRVLRKTAAMSAKAIPISAIEYFFPYIRELGPKGFERFTQYMENLDSLPRAYEAINAMMDTKEVENMLKAETEGDTVTSFPEDSMIDDKSSDMRRVMAYEKYHQLPNKNLMKTDKTSMAHSLELRSPLLNQRTLSFSSNMQSSHLRGKGGKKVFKRAMRPYLPERIRGRQKQRMLMPIHEWIRDDPWWTMQELSDRYGVPSVLERSEIKNMIAGLESSPLYYSRQLWNVAHFIVWHDRYM